MFDFFAPHLLLSLRGCWGGWRGVWLCWGSAAALGPLCRVVCVVFGVFVFGVLSPGAGFVGGRCCLSFGVWVGGASPVVMSLTSIVYLTHCAAVRTLQGACRSRTCLFWLCRLVSYSTGSVSRLILTSNFV
jgi:hypothetical protein